MLLGLEKLTDWENFKEEEGTWNVFEKIVGRGAADLTSYDTETWPTKVNVRLMARNFSKVTYCVVILITQILEKAVNVLFKQSER